MKYLFIMIVALVRAYKSAELELIHRPASESGYSADNCRFDLKEKDDMWMRGRHLLAASGDSFLRVGLGNIDLLELIKNGDIQ